MVRGNWQKRVERTESRRVAAKQRKQKRDNRSAYKSLVHDLFGFLDKHESEIRERFDTSWTLHVWLDSIPEDSPPLLDMYGEDPDGNGEGRRKGRSVSFGEEPKRKGRSVSFGEEPKRKGRVRSNSINESPGSGKKKVHPRSKEFVDQSTDDGEAFVPLLCRKQFYLGKCDGLKSGKKGGCRHVHHPKQQKTLADLLSKDPYKKRNSLETLKASEQGLIDATADDADDTEAGGMDMLYYASVSPKVPNASDSDDAVSPPSKVLTSALAGMSVGMASIVYVIFEDTMIYDRYREGLVVSDNTMTKVVLGDDGRRSRSSSMAAEAEEVENVDVGDVIPGQVLEYILTFLPDSSVAAMSRVCEHWNNEIGRISPALWKHLLQRRNWPVVEGAGDDVVSAREGMKADFLMHYAIVRDTQTVRDFLCSSSKMHVNEEGEMVVQVFSTRRLAPQSPNGCIGVHVWGPNQVLAAYSHDCTLRLFKAVDRSSEGGSPRACREIVCVCVDPYRNTKRQNCRLVATGLDSDTIGCLCHVQDADNSESFKLVVITRNDFLCADGSSANDVVGWGDLDDGVLNVIDVGEAVLNHVLSCDEIDHRLIGLFDFLTDGGDIADVEVLVSQSIAACGYGRYLFEVTISVPVTVEGIEDDDSDIVTMTLMDRKLVLISATAGAIVWMGDSSLSSSPLPRNVDMTMTCLRQPAEGGSRLACSIALASTSSPAILFTEISPSGHVQCVQSLEDAELVRNEILVDYWELQPVNQRPIVITDTDIVAADCLFEQVTDDRKRFKSVISFYPRFATDLSYDLKELEGHCEVVRIVALRDQHIIVLLRLYSGSAVEIDLDGYWFGDGTTNEASLIAVLIHVPSRREIHRICLSKDTSVCEASPTYDLPIFFDSAGDTVGVGLWWKGILLTGADVRAVGCDSIIGDAGGVATSLPKSGKKKKKKQRQPIRSSKKDGFARGMSMSG